MTQTFNIDLKTNLFLQIDVTVKWVSTKIK